jgi:hypothetical protein
MFVVRASAHGAAAAAAFAPFVSCPFNLPPLTHPLQALVLLLQPREAAFGRHRFVAAAGDRVAVRNLRVCVRACSR